LPLDFGVRVQGEVRFAFGLQTPSPRGSPVFFTPEPESKGEPDFRWIPESDGLTSPIQSKSGSVRFLGCGCGCECGCGCGGEGGGFSTQHNAPGLQCHPAAMAMAMASRHATWPSASAKGSYQLLNNRLPRTSANSDLLPVRAAVCVSPWSRGKKGLGLLRLAFGLLGPRQCRH
jgi:hypothetical protein